jgi:hypothetical protein
MLKVLVVLLLVGAGVYFGLRLASGGWGVAAGGASVAERRATAEAIATRTGAEGLDEQVVAASTAVAERQPFTLVITEAEANARLAQAGPPPTVDTPLGPAELRDPYLQLRPGEGVVSARLVGGSVSAPVTAFVGISVDPQRRAVVQVRRVDLGGIPLPDSVRQQVQDASQAQLGRALGDLPANVERIDLEDGRMTVTGTG